MILEDLLNKVRSFAGPAYTIAINDAEELHIAWQTEDGEIHEHTWKHYLDFMLEQRNEQKH